jgi:hypothetical protein
MSTTIITEIAALLPSFLFDYTGTVSAYECATTPPNPPSNIVRTSDCWIVEFDWTTTGLLNAGLSGEWKLEVFLEQMGHGELTTLLPADTQKTIVFNPGNLTSTTPPEHHFNEKFTFAAGKIPAGLYRVTTVITAVLGVSPSVSPAPLAGFADLGLVQFFDY